MSELQDTLKRCAERVQRYRQLRQRVGESNTKAGLIEPIIAALGWDVLDPDEVHREYRRRPTDNPVDYALLLLRTPRLFIEAKGLGENLDDPRWANQTISYAAVAGVEWVALTDGAEWRVFNAHAPVPVEQKLFRSVRVEDVGGALELLSLLSKDNMRDNRIEELWKGFFVDRQVSAALTEMFSDGEPARDLVNLVAKRVTQLSRGDVRSSLMRARVTFDFPSSAPPIPAGPSDMPSMVGKDDSETRSAMDMRPVTASVPRAARQAQRPRVSAAERKIKVRDLIAAGLLTGGTTLTGEYGGQWHTAELLADASVRYRGETHRSLSGAGRSVKLAVSGPNTPDTTLSTDGWGFWGVTNASGGWVSLKDLRRQAAGGA
jgi:hypothetical protein